jgi:FdhD protein
VDDLAEEVPVALEYNGISHAVMLASPSDLTDFALGFSLSEGVIDNAQQLYDCDVVHGDCAATLAQGVQGIRVVMRIAAGRFAGLKHKRRQLAGRTGCGLCGVESLASLSPVPQPVHSTLCITPTRLHQAFMQLAQQQVLQQRTGATHAAGWLGADGALTLVREDVGRHNALDKLIGALAAAGADFASGAALITSRASYEMVQKAAVMGIGVLAAVSAPTALAHRLAEQTGVTLLGFVRQGNCVVYAHPHRLRQASAGLTELTEGLERAH